MSSRDVGAAPGTPMAAPRMADGVGPAPAAAADLGHHKSTKLLKTLKKKLMKDIYKYNVYLVHN